MKKQKNILKNNSRIGIINRGEPAIRFIRAVKEYNALYNTELETVAFYLDIEQNALFVKEADVAYPLSEIPGFFEISGIAYLNKEFMLKALLHTLCSGVWVGWGFVAEDHLFAEMIENSGLVFMGPSSKAMEQLGDKIVAKENAQATQTPILPWSKCAITGCKTSR